MKKTSFGIHWMVLAAACSLTTGTAFAKSSNESLRADSNTARGEGGGHGGGGGGGNSGGGHGGGHGGGNPGGGFPGGGHGGGNPGGGFPGGGHGGGNPGGGFPGGGNPGGGHGGGNPGGGNPGGGNPGGGFPGGGNPGGGHGGGNPGGGFPGGGNPGGGHGGGNPGGGFPGGGHGGGNPGGGFPGGGHGGNGPHWGHDDHGNVVSPGHFDHMRDSERRMDERMRHDDRIEQNVSRYRDTYRDSYRDHGYERYDHFHGSYDLWRDRYSPWWNRGFYGGYHWEVRPYYDIDTYFYNPMVAWFYSNTCDEYYARTWYGSDYDTYPELRQPFSRAYAFFPTEELRDMNLGVSSMPALLQVNYRAAVSLLADRLESELRRRFRVSLTSDDIVINHYQMLQDDAGVVVEGFVTQSDSVEFPFKAFLDLRNPSGTQVFIPQSFSGEPSYEEMRPLDQLNALIADLGGEIEGDNNADRNSDL